MQAIGPIVEQPLEHFRTVQDTNCTGPVRMIQAFAPAMIKQAYHGPSVVLWPCYSDLMPVAMSTILRHIRVWLLLAL